MRCTVHMQKWLSQGLLQQDVGSPYCRSNLPVLSLRHLARFQGRRFSLQVCLSAAAITCLQVQTQAARVFSCYTSQPQERPYHCPHTPLQYALHTSVYAAARCASSLATARSRFLSLCWDLGPRMWPPHWTRGPSLKLALNVSTSLANSRWSSYRRKHEQARVHRREQLHAVTPPPPPPHPAPVLQTQMLPRSWT